MKLASPALRALATAWYGVIPDDWGVQKFKHLATIRNGQVDPEDPRFRDLPLFAPNHVESGTGRLLGIESADEQGAESGKYLVRKGEIVYSKIRPALRKAALAPCDGLCSADMYPVTPRGHADARFLLFEMLSEGFSRYSVLESDRVAMPKINRDALGECPFVFPNLPRQKAIATFLDRKTASIDDLIIKKERLIELLQEKRQALITQAVTKGLDPSVPMKDSGVEWLRKVPAHWGVRRVKNVVEFVTSGSRGWAEFYSDSGPLFLRIGNLDAESVRLDLRDVQRVSPPRGTEGQRTRVQIGDVLVSITALIGAVAAVREDLGEAYVNQHLALVRPIVAKVVPTWLGYALAGRSGVAQVESLMNGGTKVGLGLDDVRGVWLCLPPLSEQAGIASWLDRQVESIGKTIRQLEEQIAKVHEYRKSLISAAVTGQLDIPVEGAA